MCAASSAGWVRPAAVARLGLPRLLPRRRCSPEQLRQAGGFWSSSAARAGELLVPVPGRRGGGGVQVKGFCPPSSSPLRRRGLRRGREECEVGARSCAALPSPAGRGGEGGSGGGCVLALVGDLLHPSLAGRGGEGGWCEVGGLAAFFEGARRGGGQRLVVAGLGCGGWERDLATCFGEVWCFMPRSGVERARRVSPADGCLRLRSSSSGLVVVAALERLLARGSSCSVVWLRWCWLLPLACAPVVVSFVSESRD